MDAISRGWALVTSAEVVRLVLGLIASLVVARALGPAEYGIYAVLAAMVALWGALAEGGVSEAAVCVLGGLACGWVGVRCDGSGLLATAMVYIDDDGTLVRWARLGIGATAI